MSNTISQINKEIQKAPIEPCQIFLIEDDFDDRILAEKELNYCKLVKNVQSFKDGKALTDYMEKEGFFDHSVMLYSPILILVDLEMPRKDGLQVIKELKEDPFLKPIPLIVITGTKSPEKIQAAKELGAVGVFRKPLTNNMIYKYLEKAWQWPHKDMWYN